MSAAVEYGLLCGAYGFRAGVAGFLAHVATGAVLRRVWVRRGA